MSNYWFFVSYARRNNVVDEYVKKFFQMLAVEVGKAAALRANIGINEIGFFDESGIETGAAWERSLCRALHSSRVLVCLLSRSYFESTWCGKEFQAFAARLQSYAADRDGDAEPPLILPVLWDRPEELPSNLPAAVMRIQFDHDALG